MKEIQEASQAILNNRCRLVTEVQLREKANEFQENLKKTVDWMVCKKDAVDTSSHNQVSNVQTQEAETKPSKSPVRKQLTRRPSTAFLWWPYQLARLCVLNYVVFRLKMLLPNKYNIHVKLLQWRDAFAIIWRRMGFRGANLSQMFPN